YPDNHFILFNLGWTYLQLGQASVALGFLRRSLERSKSGDTTLRKLYALLTQCYRRLGKWGEAAAVCGEGLARFPRDTELLYQDGLMRYRSGDLAGAEGCLRRVLEEPSEHGLAPGADPGLRGPKSPPTFPATCPH